MFTQPAGITFTADELRLETGLAELAIAAGTADPDDVTYRAALEKHLSA